MEQGYSWSSKRTDADPRLRCEEDDRKDGNKSRALRRATMEELKYRDGRSISGDKAPCCRGRRKDETEAQERSGMCVILETNSYSSVFEDKGSDPGE